MEIFDKKFEGISFSTCDLQKLATFKQIYRLILDSAIMLRVRETSVVGSNKRELKVMESFKYKFSFDSCRLLGGHYLPQVT